MPFYPEIDLPIGYKHEAKTMSEYNDTAYREGYEAGHKDGLQDRDDLRLPLVSRWQQAAELVALVGLKLGMVGYVEALEMALEANTDNGDLSQREGSADLITMTGKALIDALDIEDSVSRVQAYEMPLPVMAKFVCERIRGYKSIDPHLRVNELMPEGGFKSGEIGNFPSLRSMEQVAAELASIPTYTGSCVAPEASKVERSVDDGKLTIPATCSNCGGDLPPDRLSVCKSCAPDAGSWSGVKGQ